MVFPTPHHPHIKTEQEENQLFKTKKFNNHQKGQKTNVSQQAVCSQK